MYLKLACIDEKMATGDLFYKQGSLSYGDSKLAK